MHVHIVNAGDGSKFSGNQTAHRALELLHIFASSPNPLSLADVVSRTGLNRSAAYRVIRALEDQNLIARDAHGRRYHIGVGLIALSAMVLEKVSARKSGRQFMDRIAASTGETVSLQLRNGRYRVCVDVVESQQELRRVIPLGQTLPLYDGPTGKAILAYLGPQDTEDILRWASEQGQDAASLQARLKRIRQQGYIAVAGDRQPGISGLSVPLFDSAGVVGAITVSGPSGRWNVPAMQAVAPIVVSECAAWSQTLGYIEGAALYG
jgi:DNA-binding IclR family transcriptional regulator